MHACMRKICRCVCIYIYRYVDHMHWTETVPISGHLGPPGGAQRGAAGSVAAQLLHGVRWPSTTECHGVPRRSRECAKPEGFEALFGRHDGFMGFHGGSINMVFPTSWLVDFMFFLINMDDAAPSYGNLHIFWSSKTWENGNHHGTSTAGHPILGPNVGLVKIFSGNHCLPSMPICDDLS
jgi:hypothetical protein